MRMAAGMYRQGYPAGGTAPSDRTAPCDLTEAWGKHWPARRERQTATCTRLSIAAGLAGEKGRSARTSSHNAAAARQQPAATTKARFHSPRPERYPRSG